MRFILIEADGKEVELPTTDEDFHFYGNPATGLYYYDGHKYVEIAPGVANKLARRKEEEENPESDADKEARKARVKKIKGALASGDLYNELETDRVFYGSDEGATDVPTRKVTGSKQKLVIESIKDFISEQIGLTTAEGYGKDHPFALDPETLKKIRKHKMEPKDIEIGVYFDRSGSWSGSYVSDFGNDIVSVLKEFEEDEELEMRGIHVHTTVYYFAVHVWEDEARALAEYNNGGEPIIQHMIANQPTNVIIMTDRDMQTPDDSRWWTSRRPSYMKSKYVAPGGVWGIFIGGAPTNLIKGYGSSEWHLYGEEHTEVFELGWGEK